MDSIQQVSPKTSEIKKQKVVITKIRILNNPSIHPDSVLLMDDPDTQKWLKHMCAVQMWPQVIIEGIELV